MSADTEGLARFDTRRSIQTDEHSHQTDLRAIGVREHGQLALNELHASTQETETSSAERSTETTRNDLEAALGCARATIDGLQEHIDHSDRDTDDRLPLAQLVDVPAERATEFLSANQLRGRKIAQRAREIGTKTPEGLVVRSDQITEQLRRWGESSHTETVSRVIDFITDLGGDDVRETMHKGRRILVFEPDRVREYGTGEEPSTIKSHRDVIPARMNGGGTATA